MDSREITRDIRHDIAEALLSYGVEWTGLHDNAIDSPIERSVRPLVERLNAAQARAERLAAERREGIAREAALAVLLGRALGEWGVTVKKLRGLLYEDGQTDAVKDADRHLYYAERHLEALTTTPAPDALPAALPAALLDAARAVLQVQAATPIDGVTPEASLAIIAACDAADALRAARFTAGEGE